MKLDNIIYDTDTLTKAITEQLVDDSESFSAIYPSDTSTNLVNTLSAYGSMLQYQLVSSMANCYTDTAYSTNGIYQLANTLGNTLHGNVSSRVKVSMIKKNLLGKVQVVPAETQFVLGGKQFFNPSAIILPSSTDRVRDIVLMQGEILEVNKVSSGVENERFYFSTDFKCNHNYIKVKVNGEEWNVAESFLPYDKNNVYDPSEMNVVVLVTEPDGKSYIKVGNNQLGNMPPSGSDINIRYVSNDGEDGNIAEVNVEGELSTPLVFLDNQDVQTELDLSIISTTTAYDGFSKQSVETLAYTSPYVFASGHRAIRRQDYNALLQNQCGYLTSNVWGEYEQSDKVGAYDSLMMNMVYYTGLKSFQQYPYFNIGYITDPNLFRSTVNSARGFWGSFLFRIRNLKNTNSYVTVQDTGATGQLFINNDVDDPRDSLLPDWIQSTVQGFVFYLSDSPIAASGLNYHVGDELFISNTNDELSLRVDQVDSTGAVKQVRLLKQKASKNYTSTHENPFDTVYATTGSGSGLKVNIFAKANTFSTIVSTNDDKGIVGPPPTQLNPIENARSDKSSTVFYRSLFTPSLQKPVQIILSYPDVSKGIAAFKFKACEPSVGPLFETIAVYGTNIDPMPSLNNIRNSENWVHIIDRKVIDNPYNNNNQNWTDWIPTNCFQHKKGEDNLPLYNRYKYYVIEFYSTAKNIEYSNDFITINKMKVLYEEDASLIYYSDNGKIDINLPKAGSPGPDSKNEQGYLTYSLINRNNLPQYAYDCKVENVTTANGYVNGNLLAYVVNSGDKKIVFYVEVLKIDEGLFKIFLENNDILAGVDYIALADPGSLDLNIVYKSELQLEGTFIPVEDRGTGYKPNDILTVNGTDNQLKLRVVTIDGVGGVLSVVWIKDYMLDKAMDGKFETTLVNSPTNSSGTGLKVNLVSKSCSGQSGNTGKGGTINIMSNPNLQVEAGFTGNRINTEDVGHYDQPIIDQYNHFTTYLEFKQPEVQQVELKVKVSLVKDSKFTSGVVLQNVKNSINKLFMITPDYLGKGLKLSDIYASVYVVDGVEWCKILTPVDNIEVDKNVLLIPTLIDIEEVITPFK